MPGAGRRSGPRAASGARIDRRSRCPRGGRCRGQLMPQIRVAAIGVSHWHSLYDSAYLRHLVGLPDCTLVALHDTSADIAAKRAAVLGHPPTFADYREMLVKTRPDFVIALGPH